MGTLGSVLLLASTIGWGRTVHEDFFMPFNKLPINIDWILFDDTEVGDGVVDETWEDEGAKEAGVSDWVQSEM